MPKTCGANVRAGDIFHITGTFYLVTKLLQNNQFRCCWKGLYEEIGKENSTTITMNDMFKQSTICTSFRLRS